MKTLRWMLAAAVVLTCWQAHAQTARRLVPSAPPQIVNGKLDITKSPFVVDYAYKKIDHLTATVCAAGVASGPRPKHATAFFNLGPANCDPFKTATVFTTISTIGGAKQYVEEKIGQTVEFKNVFFKRDNDRDRFIAHAELSNIAFLEGKDYVAIPKLRADLVRTDSPKAQAQSAAQAGRGQTTAPAQQQMTNGKDRTSATPASATPASGAARTTPNQNQRSQSIFQRFLKIFE